MHWMLHFTPSGLSSTLTSRASPVVSGEEAEHGELGDGQGHVFQKRVGREPPRAAQDGRDSSRRLLARTLRPDGATGRIERECHIALRDVQQELVFQVALDQAIGSPRAPDDGRGAGSPTWRGGFRGPMNRWARRQTMMGEQLVSIAQDAVEPDEPSVEEPLPGDVRPRMLLDDGPAEFELGK